MGMKRVYLTSVFVQRWHHPPQKPDLRLPKMLNHRSGLARFDFNGWGDMGIGNMQRDPYDPLGRAFFSGLVWMLTGGTIAVALLIGLNHQISDRLFAALNALLNPPQPQP
jgi:hypothetical protein